jgi:hypothetical protein
MPRLRHELALKPGMNVADVGAGSELVFPVRRLAPDGLEAWKQVVKCGYEGCVAKDETSVDDGGARGGGVQQKELDGSRKDRWQGRILGEDTPDGQSGVRRLDVLALICAERTRQRARFQSSSALRVLLSPRVERHEFKRRHTVTRNHAERLRAGSAPALVC